MNFIVLENEKVIKRTSNKDDILKLIVEHDLNEYRGNYKDLASEISSTKRTIPIKIIVSYETIIECRIFEQELRKRCTKFSPKKYRKNATLAVHGDLKSELDKLCIGTESYESIIWRLVLKENGLI